MQTSKNSLVRAWRQPHQEQYRPPHISLAARKSVCQRLIYGMLAVSLLLLAGVLFSPQLNGTRRWFFLAGLSLQPSELAKLALVPFIAYQIDKKQGEVNRASLLVPVAAATALVASLILFEPDMGTAVLLGGTALLLVFLAGLSWSWVASALALVPPLLWLLVMADATDCGEVSPTHTRAWMPIGLTADMTVKLLCWVGFPMRKSVSWESRR